MSPIVGSIAMFVLISFCTCSAVITTTPLNFAVGALYGIVPGKLHLPTRMIHDDRH